MTNERGPLFLIGPCAIVEHAFRAQEHADFHSQLIPHYQTIDIMVY